MGVSADIAEEQIREGIAGANRGSVIEVKDPLGIDGILLILLGGNKVSAELQGVVAENLGHIVAIGVSGIGVFPWEIAGIGGEAAAIGQAVGDRKRWE